MQVCKTAKDEGGWGVYKGHFQFPDGMVVEGPVGGGCPNDTSVVYVSDEHCFFVKGSSAYFSLGVLCEGAVVEFGV